MTPWEMLSGKEAEDFMNKMIAESDEEDKKHPEKYDRFGYKWNVNEKGEAQTKYCWVEGMHEISGFGTTYEECCRYMVTKGLEFLDKYTGKEKPRYITYKNIYGIAEADNKLADILRTYLCKAPEDYFGKSFGPSGAQFQAVTSHICWILEHSWDEYVAKMKEKK